MNAIGSQSMDSLPHLCADLLTLATQLRCARDPGTIDLLGPRTDELFSELERQARSAGIDRQDVEMGRYALAALIDEIILSSQWEIREEWTKQPLQMKYFNEYTAGEGFYERLETLRGTASPSKRGLLEVYSLCLALGFRGKYAGLEGAERIRALKKDLNRELGIGVYEKGNELSPRWQASDGRPESIKKPPVWIVAAICAFVLLVSYLVLEVALPSLPSEFRG